MQHHQFIRMQPELLIQTVTAAKILEEQREARTNQSPFNFGYFLDDLKVKIQTFHPSKDATRSPATPHPVGDGRQNSAGAARGPHQSVAIQL